jgi:hypothetical protein
MSGAGLTAADTHLLAVFAAELRLARRCAQLGALEATVGQRGSSTGPQSSR